MPLFPLRTIVRFTRGTLLQSVTRLRKGRVQAIELVQDTSTSTGVMDLTGNAAVSVSADSLNNVNTKPTRRAWRRISRGVTKDTFILGLEALAESADVCPPLKSVICGLLFFVKQADIVSSNKEQIANIHAQIDAMVASLVRTVPDMTELSPVAKDAIHALAADIQAVCTDMEGIQRKHWPLRFVRARQYSSRLDRLVKSLAEADAVFTRTMLTNVETKSTQILAYVQPLQGDIHRLTEAMYFFFDPSKGVGVV